MNADSSCPGRINDRANISDQSFALLPGLEMRTKLTDYHNSVRENSLPKRNWSIKMRGDVWTRQ
jgi:hypothetical protein